MAKFLTPDDYEEVEAFTKEELEAKLTEAKAEWEKESGTSAEEIKIKLAEIEKERDEVKTNYEKVSKLHEGSKKSIADLKEALNKKDNNINDVSTEKKQAFEKMRDTRFNAIIGEDKEYGEALKAQFERVGKETLDIEELDRSIKEAHTLALLSLEREITPFNPGAMGQGDAPQAKPQEKVEHEKRVDSLADYATNLMGIKKAE